MSGPEAGEPGGGGEPTGWREAVAPAGDPMPPEPSSRFDLGLSFGLWIGLLALGLAILLVVAPSFEPMFKDIGLPLPAPTALLLDASHLVRSPIGLAGAALVVLGSIGILRLPWPRSRKVLIFNLLSLAAILSIPFVVIGLFLPIGGGLIQSVGPRDPGIPR